MKGNRFHGRHDARGRQCYWPGCEEDGEFRAPGPEMSGFDGPGQFRWFCLNHVREFNSGYDYFDGMSSEEILRAQSPIHGWDRETRAFRADAGIDSVPRWADYTDPLEAISARARRFKREAAERTAQPQERNDGFQVTAEERAALATLGLNLDADRKALRNRYAEMLRRYHPDHNGGDRAHETRLRSVVAAYQLLRKSTIFS